MLDFSREIRLYHNEQVVLSAGQLAKLRSVRDANRQRVKEGLKQLRFRQPLFYSQGSYAMKTVIWKDDQDFDIDDGVYFDKECLTGPRGAELSPLQARQLICQAVDNGTFKQAPEVRNHCVRIWYSQGYHVDMPVYRKICTQSWWGAEKIHFELASSQWKRADARAVTDWLDHETERHACDGIHGGQLRRVIRLIKDLANSRPSWRPRTATGFMIAVLVAKSFKPVPERDDVALLETMKAIASSFWWSYSIQHPVITSETLNRNEEDARPKFFHQQLREALKTLEELRRMRDTRQSLAIWNRVFNTDYFTTCFASLSASAR